MRNKHCIKFQIFGSKKLSAMEQKNRERLCALGYSSSAGLPSTSHRHHSKAALAGAKIGGELHAIYRVGVSPQQGWSFATSPPA
jgi:hypothetical protein